MLYAQGSSWTGSGDGTSDVYAKVAMETAVEYTASGAIAEKNGFVVLNAGSALAMTIAAPTAGGKGVGDDGKVLNVISQTAYAHVLTIANFNGASSGTITYAKVGDGSVLVAYNGYWYIRDSALNQQVVAYTTATAITQKTGLVQLSGTQARAMTLADPVTGTDDGKVLTVVAGTAFAHTLTVASNYDATHAVATYAAVGDNIVLMANKGKWTLLSYSRVTLS